jgi:hypothetical protein
MKKAPASLKLTGAFLNGAVWTGLEPATSAVTGRHSNQLNYQTVCQRQKTLPFSALVLQR